MLDTGSYDSTAEIARSFGAVVVRTTAFSDRFGRMTDFAAARNACLDIANGDWILQLDADEVLEAGHDRILRHIRDGTAKSLAVSVFSGSSQWLAVRLFRKSAQHLYEGIIYECIRAPEKTETDRSIVIRNLPDKRGRESSVDRDIRLCSRGLEMFPRDARYHIYLARALRRAGEYAEAINVYRVCERFKFTNPITLHMVHADRALCHLLLGELGEARAHALLALKQVSIVPETHCILADALLALGDVVGARQRYRQALSINQSDWQNYAFFIDAKFCSDYPTQRIEYCNEILRESCLHQIETGAQRERVKSDL